VYTLNSLTDWVESNGTNALCWPAPTNFPPAWEPTVPGGIGPVAATYVSPVDTEPLIFGDGDARSTAVAPNLWGTLGDKDILGADKTLVSTAPMVWTAAADSYAWVTLNSAGAGLLLDDAVNRGLRVGENPNTFSNAKGYFKEFNSGQYAPQLVFSARLPGDANEDGHVDISDLSILATNYEQPGAWGWGDGDFSHDGAVDISDLSILASNYETGAGTPVPEPCTLALLGLGGAALLRRRNAR
jgi:hypothetical protein